MFNNRQELSELIEQTMKQYSITMMEAVVHISEKNGVEIETIAVLIKQSPKLKETLRQEAEVAKMLK